MAETFGHWTVLGPAEPMRRASGTIKRLLCRCSCGAERAVSVPNLKSGKSRSCGCNRPERTAEAKVRHGHAREGRVTVEFSCWQAMLARCRRPGHSSYPNYGGRGIRVCERWQTFEQFLADMGSRPSPRHSLDRIDVDGHYEPGNWCSSGGRTSSRTRSTRPSSLAAAATRSTPAPTVSQRRRRRRG